MSNLGIRLHSVRFVLTLDAPAMMPMMRIFANSYARKESSICAAINLYGLSHERKRRYEQAQSK
jgi:hypothetical protein